MPEEELDKTVMLTLSETETFDMFDLPGTHVGHGTCVVMCENVRVRTTAGCERPYDR